MFFLGLSLPKYWSPSGEKLAYTVLKNDVPSGIYIYDLVSGNSKRISSLEEDIKHHSLLLAWQDSESLMVIESPLDNEEQTLKVISYNESGNRHSLIDFNLNNNFPVIDDISASYILVRDTSNGVIQLYDKSSYQKVSDIKEKLEDKNSFRITNLIGDTGKVFIKEYRSVNGENIFFKTSVFDSRTSKEEIISNDITDLGE